MKFGKELKAHAQETGNDIRLYFDYQLLKKAIYQVSEGRRRPPPIPWATDASYAVVPSRRM